MAHYGGFNFTDVQNVNLRGTGGNPGVIRSKTSGFSTTVSFGPTTTLDQNFAVNFPNKNGTMPIMGTFIVQLPAVAATTNFLTTVVTVTGIRTEDALSVTQGAGTSAGYGDLTLATSGATAKIFWTARAGNGNITLGFLNLGVATGYTEHIMHYLAVR